MGQGKIHRWKYIGLTALSICLSLVGYAQKNLFANGDKVCFVGNSITQAGEFHHQIALYYATRFPSREISFFNCGIGGNSTGDVLKRMTYDVLNNRPNWSVVKMGMNDVNRELYLPGTVQGPELEKKKQYQFEKYQANMRRIVDTLIRTGSQVILQTPTIYDQTSQMAAPNFIGRNNALDKYADFIKQLGKEYQLTVVDYHTILTEINQQLQKDDPNATIIGPDRVHPLGPGHFVMAWKYLTTMDMPKYVSSTTVDAQSGKAKAANASLSKIFTKRTIISFNSLEKSLPFPVADNVAPALNLVPFINDLDQEILSVKHLPKGSYQLSIDGNAIDTFTSDSLAKGVNLALVKTTPQYVQALKVLELCQQYWKTEADLRGIMSMEWNQLHLKRAVNLAEATEEYDQALSRSVADTTQHRILTNLRDGYLKSKARQSEWLANLSSIRDAIYKANKPVTHRYKIQRVKT